MQRVVVMYLGLAFGISALFLLLRIFASLRDLYRRSRAARASRHIPTATPGSASSRRRVASGWPSRPEGAARLH